MKKGFFTLLLLTGIYLSSCQKDTTVKPQTSATLNSQTSTVATPALNHASTSSVATPAVDTVKGYMRVQLAASATSTDNILIDFNPASSAAFVKTEDAVYLQGFGAVSLSSLTSDGTACAINTMPLTVPGRTVALNVGAKADGLYTLKLLTLSSIPINYSIWLKDRYMKDSLDFRNNNTYAFNIATKDTTSYGKNRFTIVLRKN
ncbi:MAG: hypothetical protein JWQ84_2662 [Mucilaginibacter sp.]|nr:hypothetical protein [Mucilaginibacter sp.]